MKKIFKKKKRTGRSQNPGAWSLELGAYTGRFPTRGNLMLKRKRG